MRLLIQPGDGIDSLIKAINGAKGSVEIVIFRFDRVEIERALEQAAKRGVRVHALIAYTNRGGERGLRKLEMRLLAAGITVARTANDLARYHDKYMIIDRRELFLLSFNFTRLDIENSRSFGLVTRRRELVQEAVRLFEADTKRQAYKPEIDTFVVSPVNARKQLAAFIKGAKKELLIYDPEIADAAMIRFLQERLEAGIDIRIIGKLASKKAKIAARKLSRIRLHTRTIIRDGVDAFIGSQSLRETELDARREVGVIFRDRKVIGSLREIFEKDWETTEKAAERATPEPSAPSPRQVAKKVAKEVAKKLPPMASVVKVVVRDLGGPNGDLELDRERVQETVEQAVAEAVREAVTDVVEEAAK